MTTVQLPNLPTLHEPASWLNSAGHIDRSACFELRVSAVRKLAAIRLNRPKGPGIRPQLRALEVALARSGQSYADRQTQARRLPNEKPARNPRGRTATAIFTLTPKQLLTLLNDLNPRRLVGDYRNTRAPAMRPMKRAAVAGAEADAGTIAPIAKAATTATRPIANPNRGSTRSKFAALRDDWYQPIRLERWTNPNRLTPMYYFTCPGIHPTAIPIDYSPPNYTDAFLSNTLTADPRLPYLSKLNPTHHPTACPQRVLFLLLPLCTAHEERDAHLAQKWILSLTPEQRTQHHAFITKLSTRYGLLFHPRTLVCRHCLQTRYGRHPIVMSAWRRTCKARTLPFPA